MVLRLPTLLVVLFVSVLGIRAANTGSTGSVSPTPVDNTQPTVALNWLIAASAGNTPVGETQGVEADSQPLMGEIRVIPFLDGPTTQFTGWLRCDGQLLAISEYQALFQLIGTTYGGNGTTHFALPDLRGRVPVGAGPGHPLGSKGGAETVTLTTANLPAHTHTLAAGSTQSTGAGEAIDNQQPWLALNFAMHATGEAQEMGWIRIYAFAFTPTGHFATDGTILRRIDHINLGARVQFVYGGTAPDTFATPDLRGRTPMGSIPSTRTPGMRLGGATVALTSAQMPAHTHSYGGGVTGSAGAGEAVSTLQPSLAFQWIVARTGYAGQFYRYFSAIGEMRLMAYAPPYQTTANWIVAQGGALSVSANPNLAAALGYTYGGDGSTTFNLPDMRGRLSAHIGTGTGLTARTLAQLWGAESVTLTADNLPAHTHSDVPPLTVASVGVPAAGTAKLGATLDFTVNWNSAVAVTGTPTLGLTVGTTARTASYVSGSGTTASVFRYTVQASDLDTDGIQITALDLAGGTLGGANLTLNNVGSTTGVKVDGVVPTLTAVTLASSNTNAARARANEVVTLRFTSSEAISTPTVTIAGHAVTAIPDPNNAWTANYTLVSRDTQGAVAFSIAFADTATNAGTTVTATTNSSSVVFDSVVPTISPARIALTGASGTGGAFRLGDTITATWNNSSGGDNNTDIDTVAVFFTAFGGSQVAATQTSGNWAASFQLNSPTIDATNLNVSILARDMAGNATLIAGTNNVSVDTVAPILTVRNISLSGATGNGGVFKAGDTVTATWDNSATGDNIGDIAAVTFNFTAFGGSQVAATQTSGRWTATYLLPSGTIEGTSLNIVIAVVDDAVNQSGGSGTNNVSVDNLPPAAPSAPDLAAASDSGRSDTDNITNVVTPTFTGTAAGNSSVKLFAGSTQIGSVTAGSGGAWSITASTLAPGTHAITAKAADAAGNIGVASNPLSVTIDTSAPNAPVITGIADDTGASASDGITRDTTLILNGTAEADAIVTLSKGANAIGTATAGGTSAWSFDYTGTTLGGGEHSFSAVAVDVAGNSSGTSGTYLVTVDTVSPGVPVIAGISSDTGTSATDGITSDTTLTLSGTAELNAMVTLVRSGVGVIGTVTASGAGQWSFDYGTALVDGTYIFTATAQDVAGNVSAASADFPVTVDTSAPVITASTAAGTYQTAFSYSIAATGSASGFTATPLPAGLTVDAATGAITGTPTAAGVTTVTLSATDAAGNTGTATLTITIAKATPVVSWSAPAGIVYGDALTGTQLNASASVQGSFVYTPALGAVLTAGEHTLSVLLLRLIRPTTTRCRPPRSCWRCSSAR